MCHRNLRGGSEWVCEVIPNPNDSISKVEHTSMVYSSASVIIIGEGTRASESQNPALPISQGNEEVGVGLH